MRPALARVLLAASGRRARRRLRRGDALEVRVLVGRDQRTVERWPLEDYVAGVVMAECRPEWPTAARQAIAVAARTYGLRRIVVPDWLRYHLVAGAGDQYLAGPTGPDAEALVAETSGVYLLQPGAGAGPVPAEAVYHNCCGGATDVETDVWGGPGPPAHTSVPCPPCRVTAPSWTAAFPSEVFGHLVGLGGGGAGPINVEVLESSPTGRHTRLRIGRGSGQVQCGVEALRAMVGPDRLKSGRFDWSVTGGAVRFQGTGHGHGVGLCKRGAVALAAQGWTYGRILQHYYPGFTVHRPPRGGQ
jgi:stage II sporulation protein D